MHSMMTQVARPDLIEYHTFATGLGSLEIFYDDYHGEENEGWVVRLVTMQDNGCLRELEFPMKGRKDSKPVTLRKNAIKAVCGNGVKRRSGLKP